MSVVNSYSSIFFLTVGFLIIHLASFVRSSSSTTTPATTTKAPKLPDIPNAIHYPIYIPATTTDSSSSFLSPTFDLMGLSSNPWSSSLSPLTALASSSSSSSFLPLSYDWMGQPFGIEVYDEQTLLRNREKLRRKQIETLRSREQLRQQASNVRRHIHGIPVINSYNTAFETRSDNNNNNHHHPGYLSSDSSNKKNNYAMRQVGDGSGFERKKYTSVRNSWQSEQGNSNAPIWK